MKWLLLLLLVVPLFCEGQNAAMRRRIQAPVDPITYQLQDVFLSPLAAGTLNNSYSTPNKKTSALGIRKISDTGSRLSITNGYLTTVGGASVVDPSVHWTRPDDPLSGAYVWASGKLHYGKFTSISGGYWRYIILNTAIANGAFDDLVVYFEDPATGLIEIMPNNQTTVWSKTPITYSTGLPVGCAISLDSFGGYHVFVKPGSTWNYLARWGSLASYTTYPCFHGSFAAASGKDVRINDVRVTDNYKWLPSPTLADQFHRPHVIAIGDSITLGLCGLQSDGTLYSRFWKTNWGAENTTSYAEGGKLTPWMVSNLWKCSNGPSLYTDSVFYVMGGCNDEPTNDTIRGNVFSNLCTICTNSKAFGYDKVIISTVLPKQTMAGTDFEVQRLLLNDQIRGMVPEYADAVADCGGDSTIGQSNSTYNATYYVDGIHPTEAGRVIEGGIVKAAIQSFTYTSSLVSDGKPEKIDASRRYGRGGGGLTWTEQVGTWTMEGGRAKATLTDGKGIVTIDPGVSSYHYDVFIQQLETNSIGPIVRWVDANNYIYADHDGTSNRVHEVVAGVDTVKLSSNTAWVTNTPALFRISVYGNKIYSYYQQTQTQPTASFTTTLGASTVVGLLTTSTSSYAAEVRQYPFTDPSYDAALRRIEP